MLVPCLCLLVLCSGLLVSCPGLLGLLLLRLVVACLLILLARLLVLLSLFRLQVSDLWRLLASLVDLWLLASLLHGGLGLLSLLWLLPLIGLLLTHLWLLLSHLGLPSLLALLHTRRLLPGSLPRLPSLSGSSLSLLAPRGLLVFLLELIAPLCSSLRFAPLPVLLA